MTSLVDLWDPDEGKRRRDEAMRAQMEAEANQAYRERFEAEVLAQRGTFTSEDITQVVGLPAKTIKTNANNLVGAIMHRLSADGLIVRVGSANSARARSNAATLSVWKVVR